MNVICPECRSTIDAKFNPPADRRLGQHEYTGVCSECGHVEAFSTTQTRDRRLGM